MCMSNINPAQRRYSYKMVTEIAEDIDGAPIVKCVRAVITRAIDYTKKIVLQKFMSSILVCVALKKNSIFFLR